jgi:predicted kinase
LFRRVSDQIEDVWPRCLELGLDVVLDLGFWTRQQRDDVRAKAAMIGVSVSLWHHIGSIVTRS